MKEAPPPALDQFDLDEEFASEKVRLAHLTNKCTDSDLEYYVREGGEVLGINAQLNLSEEEMDSEAGAKKILEFVMNKLVKFKMFNQEQANLMKQENDSSRGNQGHSPEGRKSPFGTIGGSAQFAKPIMAETESKEGKAMEEAKT